MACKKCLNNKAFWCFIKWIDHAETYIIPYYFTYVRLGRNLFYSSWWLQWLKIAFYNSISNPVESEWFWSGRNFYNALGCFRNLINILGIPAMEFSVADVEMSRNVQDVELAGLLPLQSCWWSTRLNQFKFNGIPVKTSWEMKTSYSHLGQDNHIQFSHSYMSKWLPFYNNQGLCKMAAPRGPRGLERLIL